MGVVAAEITGRSHDTEALYREHRGAVAALCRSLLRDRAEVEDATQQVFLSAHRALLNGAAPREPLAWLLAVARNECYARFRQRAVAPIPTGDAPESAAADASVHVMRAGEIASVWDEVGQMPPTQREAFLLREIRGLSYGQLADELSLSPPSVRSLLLRARARLRHRLGNVAAGVGGAPWVQTLVRLVAGGDGASPVPAATKAAAVGLGALALVGGGGVVAHHALGPGGRTTARHRTPDHARRAAASAHVQHEAQVGLAGRGSELGRSTQHDRSGGSSGSSRDSRNDRVSTGDSSSGSGRDGSNDTTVATQPTTNDHDGGGTSTTSTSDGGSSTSGSTSGSDGGSTSGSSSGSDGESGGSTTTVPSSSSGDSSGSDASGGGSSSDGG